MAQAKKKMGRGSQEKSDGTGAMTVLAEGVLPENMVLSNRDKALHSRERGFDSRHVQTEQYHDHVGARRNFESEGLRDSSVPLQNDGDHQVVRERAYQIWEEEGRPAGQHLTHWSRAEGELKGLVENEQSDPGLDKPHSEP